jgi:hypothetical protein
MHPGSVENGMVSHPETIRDPSVYWLHKPARKCGELNQTLPMRGTRSSRERGDLACDLLFIRLELLDHLLQLALLMTKALKEFSLFISDLG